MSDVLWKYERQVNTAIMGNWWPAKGRGLIFGLWTCHQYIGDIVAALAAGLLLNSGYDYRWYVPQTSYLVRFDGEGNINMSVTARLKFLDILKMITHLNHMEVH